MKRIAIILIITVLIGAGLTGCSSTLNNTQKGALMGGAIGALSGAIIGNNWHGKHKDSVRNGAIIGALAGAAGGAVIGNRMGN